MQSREDRNVMMPQRRNTRAHNIARAIAAERRLNDPLRRRTQQAAALLNDGEQVPFARYALELVRAATLELQP